MKSGKLPPSDLQDSVLRFLGAPRSEVLVHAGLGEDCSVVEFGDDVLVISTDPITGASANIGRLAVIISCNDVASCGAEPIGVLMTIMAPEGTSVEQIRQVMAEVDEEAKAQGIEVIGGHTEVTSAVSRFVLSSTVIGKATRDSYVTSSGAKPGDAILVTKAAGLEGTAILAQDRFAELARHLPVDLLSRAQAFLDEVSVVKDGLIAAKGRITAMHDATEGGLLGALFEMASGAGVGFEIDAERIPVREETRRICEVAGIDPLRLISSGCMVITTPDPDDIKGRLERAGVSVTYIGRITDARQGIIRYGGQSQLVNPPESDQLYVGLSNLDSRGPALTERFDG